MPRRIAIPNDELYRRAVAYVDRRGGALIRRGGRSGGGGWGKKRFDAGKLYGLSQFSPANWYQTQPNGGEAGVASGFLNASLFRIDEMPVTAGIIAERLSVAPNAGSTDSTGAGSLVQSSFVSSGAAFINTTNMLTPSDRGKLFLVVAVHTGSTVDLWVQRRRSASAAITGYAIPSGATRTTIGARVGGTLPSTVISLVDRMSARGVPSQAQIEALFDYVRQNGALPAKDIGEALMPGTTVTHRWSLRDELQKLAVPVLDGQLAPASLPDTVTQAAIDRMDRQGSPVVRVIDPGVDGRKSYGALGFSATSHLLTGNASWGSSGGFWFEWAGPITLGASSASRMIFSGFGTAPNRGVQLFTAGTNNAVLFRSFSASNAVVDAPSYGFPASGIYHLFGFWNQSTGLLEFYVNGQRQGTGTAMADHAPVLSVPGYIGYGGAAAGAPNEVFSFFGAAYGNGNVTGTDAADAYLVFSRTGRVQGVPGRTRNWWDPTADVIANGGPAAGIPAQVLDRIGTDHLTRIGTPTVQTLGSVRGVRDLTMAANYQSVPGGGIPGVAAGFNLQWFGRLEGIGGSTPSAARILLYSRGTNVGWYVISSGKNDSIAFHCYNGTTFAAATYSTVAGDAGRGIHFAFVFDGTNILVFRDEVQVAAAVLPGTYAPYVGMYLGAWPGSIGSSDLTHIGAGGGHFVPTPAQIASAASASLAAGKLVPIAGSKHWDISQDAIDSGDKLPALLRERVGGTDSLVLVGASLQVASRTERLWSYETQPILYGADNLGDTVYYESLAGGAGNALAFWGTLVFTPKSTATSATRVLLSAVQPTPNRGWDIRTAGANASASMIFTDSLNTGRASGVGTLGANVAGKICVWSFAWDGVSNKLYTWLNRAVAGSATGAAITGYTPSADGIVRIGSARHATATPGSDLAAYGFVLGVGLPTLAMIQAHHDAIMAEDGRIQAIAGMSTMLVDVTADALENGGVLPATLKDRISGNHMVRTGAPTTYPQHARSFGW